AAHDNTVETWLLPVVAGRARSNRSSQQDFLLNHKISLCLKINCQKGQKEQNSTSKPEIEWRTLWNSVGTSAF
ncbi:MAG: hypothetical protein ACK2UI_04020, partial [Anaerolineae bacterium]